MPVLDETQRHDIQGNILRAYGFGYARYSILRVVEARGACDLIRRLLAKELILSAQTWDRDQKPDAALNVSVSYTGLAALGVSEATLASFPTDFREGMAARAAKLGDIGPSAPSGWEFGADTSTTHVMISLHARNEEAKRAMLAVLHAEVAAAGSSVEIVHRLDAGVLGQGVEHFGHADGFGQPGIEGSGAPSYPGEGTPEGTTGWTPIKAGEFVLGYDSESGTPWPVPQPVELGLNGSFLVYRKLAQNVSAYRTFLKTEAARVYGSSDAASTSLLSAKLVGRWPSGCPLMLSPDRDDAVLGRDRMLNNDFRYAADPLGRTCPIGSHVRRMNPRDAQITGVTRLHRIVRRGLPYGSWLEGDQDDGLERGIAFMAINASITQQFELLQDRWGNNNEFAGRDAVEVDPFIGVRKPNARFDLRDPQDRTKRLKLPDFVTVRGGGYFFIPSLTALRYLSSLA